MGGEFSYTIQGLREFQRALGQLEGSLPTSVRELNIKAATEIVAAGRSHADAPQQALAAKSLRASRSAATVAVLLGNNGRYAFAMGAEFGARRYKQFPAWRGNQWSGWDSLPGYFLHPAIREVGAKVVDELWESVRTLAEAAFPD